MRCALTCHPNTPCDAVDRIDVTMLRPNRTGLQIVYAVEGAVEEIRLPERQAPKRTDNLWAHTCFEAFVRPDSDGSYVEFNFAPSTQWAAYRFSGYRDGMAEMEGLTPPRVTTIADARHFDLVVTIDRLPVDCLSWKVGLCAVIEETTGRLSYWASSHPPGKPDFHHGDCFAHELAVTEEA